MSDSGKGDTPRPMKITLEEFRMNYERIFGVCPMCGKEYNEYSVCSHGFHAPMTIKNKKRTKK